MLNAVQFQFAPYRVRSIVKSKRMPKGGCEVSKCKTSRAVQRLEIIMNVCGRQCRINMLIIHFFLSNCQIGMCE